MSAKTETWVVATPASTDIVITAGARELVRLKRDGSLEYGDDYTPDAAAEAFWSALAAGRPR